MHHGGEKKVCFGSFVYVVVFCVYLNSTRFEHSLGNYRV